jgi:sugar phosphate isomerase/epimerase
MNLGVQLYVFNKFLRAGEPLEPFVEAMAAAGYHGVETPPGNRELTAAMLESAGLACCGVHAVPSQGELRPENLDTLIGFVRGLGAEDVCASGLLEWNERSADDYRRSADHLNEAGRRLRKEGIHLHYHNHEFEFVGEVEDGRNGMEVLLDALDPDACTLCLDLGWVWAAGIDPAGWVCAHARWVGYVHLRDWAGERRAAALGEGMMPQEPVFHALAGLPNLRQIVVEHDPVDVAGEGIRRMKASAAFVREMADP